MTTIAQDDRTQLQQDSGGTFWVRDLDGYPYRFDSIDSKNWPSGLTRAQYKVYDELVGVAEEMDSWLEQ